MGGDSHTVFCELFDKQLVKLWLIRMYLLV